MDITTLITFLMPLVVFGATYIVKWASPKLSGITIVAVVVPVLSVAGAFLESLLGGTTGFWLQAVLNMLAVTINEIVKQLKQATTTPNP
jgi:hypothetical protein